MSFVSFNFFVFLIVFLVFYKLFKNSQARKWVILLFSIAFYLIGEKQYFYLLAFIGLTDYLIARKITTSSKFIAKFLLYLSCLKNTSILIFFKYGTSKLSLPLGLSFFTFQSLSYVSDIYMHKKKKTDNFLSFFTYLFMFPQLVAGPICRSSQLIVQLQNLRKPTDRQIYDGLCLFITGIFKKVIIADYLAIFVNSAFNQAERFTRYDYWVLVIISFGVQIYFDFMSYTDIARGIGKFLGVELPINFNFPYFARSLSDFWRKWHITLSTWFRDYIYIPLGGSKKSQVHFIFAILITFTLSGAWHGGGINFIIWGGFHAMAMLIEKLIFLKSNLSLRILKRFYMLIIVFIGWIFFRSENINQALNIISHIFTLETDAKTFGLINSFGYVYLILITALVFEVFSYFSNKRILNIPSVSILIHTLLAAVSILFYAETQTFIYFRF